MKALTICQPYAELILRGEKPVENRNWWCSYRGPLLIHAGKNRDWLKKYEEAVKTGTFPGPKSPLPKDMAFGAIVGKVDMVDCVRKVEIGKTVQRKGRYKLMPEVVMLHPEYLWLEDHPHAGGPFCFVLENPMRFQTPIPWPGKQGIFDIPDEMVM